MALREAADQEVLEHSIRGLRRARFKQEAGKTGSGPPTNQGGEVNSPFVEASLRDTVSGASELGLVRPANRSGCGVHDRKSVAAAAACSGDVKKQRKKVLGRTDVHCARGGDV